MAKAIIDRDGETIKSAKREVAKYLMEGAGEIEMEVHLEHLSAEGGVYGEPVYVTITETMKNTLLERDFPYAIY